MARPRKIQSTDDLIEKAEQKVLKKKAEYDAAVSELKELREKKQKENQELLLATVAKSKRSLEEILEFLRSEPEENE